ncbi:sterol carrier protein 2-like [Sycon ciliatum]|uniref:sterol carrier protein 2-like n=1 Tax=Sycon ciliatum TaxID=27933 RepID=UPI0031F6FE65
MADFQSHQVFVELEKRLREDPAVAKKIKGIYCFQLHGGPGGKSASWVVDLKSATPSIAQKDGKADCTIKMQDGDFVKLMTGKLDAQKAFFGGKLKISGNMALAMKLKELQPKAPKSKL